MERQTATSVLWDGSGYDRSSIRMRRSHSSAVTITNITTTNTTLNVEIQWIFHGEFYFKFNYIAITVVHNHHPVPVGHNRDDDVTHRAKRRTLTARMRVCARAPQTLSTAVEGSEKKNDAAKLYNLFFINNNKLYERMRSFGKTNEPTTASSAAAVMSHRASNDTTNRKIK